LSLNLISNKNKEIEYHIRIKTNKLIVLRFWIESGVNLLCVG